MRNIQLYNILPHVEQLLLRQKTDTQSKINADKPAGKKKTYTLVVRIKINEVTMGYIMKIAQNRKT